MANQVIDLLFGVYGGDSISIGTSGGNIKRDIDSIVHKIQGPDGVDIKFQIEKKSAATVKQQLDAITRNLKATHYFRLQFSAAQSSVDNLRQQIESGLQNLNITFNGKGNGGTGGGTGKGGTSEISRIVSLYREMYRLQKQQSQYLDTSATFKLFESEMDEVWEEIVKIQGNYNMTAKETARVTNLIVDEERKLKQAIELRAAAQKDADAKRNNLLEDSLDVQKLQAKLQEFRKAFNAYSQQTYVSDTDLAPWKSIFDKVESDFNDAVNKAGGIDKAFTQITQGSMQDWLRQIGEALAGMKNTYEIASALPRELTKSANSFNKLANRAQDYYNRIYKTLSRDPMRQKQLESLIEKLRTPGSFNSVVEASAAFQKLQLEIKQAGLETETLWQTVNRIFKEKFGYGVMASLAMEARSSLKLVYQNVVQLDAKMTELQIVSGATWREMTQIMDGAAEAAKRVASSITDIVDATTVYRRLGFANALALDFAELTTMYSKVGGVEMAEAESSVTSIIKAFGLEDVDDLKLAMDQLIMVGNNFAISSGELGEGLQNSGSALMAAGNTFTESLAILTSANNVVQDISKASTAMRTISARLRQSNAELQELGEDALSSEYDTTSKYRAKLLAITGVDILEDDMKTFRSTYDILKDIAAVWDSLQDIDKAAVTEMIGGVRNQNIVASLMTSYEDAEKIMAVTTNAAGSMAKAYESYTDSIEGRTNTMIATFQELSSNILDSDLVKTAITGVTELVSIVNSLVDAIGLIGPTIAGAGIYQFIKSVGGAKMIALKSAPTYVPVVTRNEYAA